MKTPTFILLLVFNHSFLFGQATFLSSEFGYSVPVRTDPLHPLRILFVFGEVVASNNGNTCWPAGTVPLSVESWMDPTYSTNPSGYITKYFYDASFGQYIVLGDYVDQVIPVTSYGDQAGLFAGLNQLYTTNSNSLPTHFGSILNDTQNDFDYYNLQSGMQGFEKLPAQDGGIDVLIFSVREGGEGGAVVIFNSNIYKIIIVRLKCMGFWLDT